MTAQTITAQGVIFNSTSSSNASNTKGTSVDSDFSKYLSGNLKSANQETASHDEKKVKDTKHTNTNASSTTSKNQVVNSSKEMKEVKDVKAVHKVNDDLGKEISNISEKIKSMVKDTLDISEDELKNLMSTLGLTMLDLMNPDNMKNLVLAASGETDITAVLTNEGLSNQLTNLLQEISELNVDDFDITEEELKYLMENNNHEANLDKNIIGPNPKEASIDISSGKLNTVNENVSNVKEEIIFTVHKEGSMNDTKDIQDTFEVKEQINSTNTKVSAEQDMQSDTETTNSSQSQKNQDNAMDSKTDQFINNLNVTSIRSVDGVNQEIVEVTQIRDIVNQIVKEIRINIKPDSTGMELQLNPENLGKVNLSVTTKDGMLTAQFNVQNSIAKEAIESQVQVLKENLNNQGVKVESIEVTVSNFTFSKSDETFHDSQEQKHSKRALKLDGFEESNDLGTDSNISDMLMNGSTVSYTA